MSRRQLPQALALFRPLGDAAASAYAGQQRKAWASMRLFLAPQRLHSYEEDLERASLARRFFQPIVQARLSAWGGYGNDRCVIGRQGWLFYQPDVEYLIGPDLLDEGQLQLRRKRLTGDVAEPQPDPRPAIFQLHQDCRNAGVHLVLVPVPDKAALQPAQLTRRFEDPSRESLGHSVPLNTGYAPCWPSYVNAAWTSSTRPLSASVRTSSVTSSRTLTGRPSTWKRPPAASPSTCVARSFFPRLLATACRWSVAAGAPNVAIWSACFACQGTRISSRHKR